jgi:hypothetical protein
MSNSRQYPDSAHFSTTYQSTQDGLFTGLLGMSELRIDNHSWTDARV